MKLFPLKSVTFADTCHEADQDTRQSVTFGMRRNESNPDKQVFYATEEGNVIAASVPKEDGMNPLIVFVPASRVQNFRYADGVTLAQLAAMENAAPVDFGPVTERLDRLSMDVRASMGKKR
jgi:hypothetical protein